MHPLSMFGQNMVLLLGLLCSCFGGLVLAIAAWTFGRIGLWYVQRLVAERSQRRQRYGPDGKPVAAIRRGVCERCGHVFPRVYELHDGRSYCSLCYGQRDAPPGRTGDPPSDPSEESV